MSHEATNMDVKEDKLVHLYQDIMQCEEDHAKSVFILLSEVLIEKPPYPTRSSSIPIEP